ncbi:hypothetical protein [Clostridium perfringens]|uniref:hypothetical protein n=1 Tax=Clostridium perfringens TaxID=1502 RepID=UPI002342511A|nr:hypothetical protein [Clostridium perfringens]MDC4245549.1 hypothetical protein [Clostridium perfringens]
MVKRKTHEEFVRDLNKIHGEGVYIPLENYINSSKKIKVRHSSCGYEWRVIPNSLLRGIGCPKCGERKRIKNKTKDHKEFIKEIKEKYGDEYEILGEYKGNKRKLLVKHNCISCNNYKWEIIPNSLLRGRGCPVCANKKVILGVNTIWDTDRWMINLGISEENAKRYSRCSNKKITVKCPDCGREKEMVISNLYNCKSIFCSCGDGKSYPEKFIFNLLKQLDIDFEIEYKPKWIENKRYDFHISNSSCIIETHGEQHYDGNFISLGGRSLKQEQLNDKYKKETALKNGIKHYIELDCRESNIDYIKNSILNSELNKLYDLSNINWNKCAEFANKNIVKEVCEYWNDRKDSETTGNLANVFNLSTMTIRNYLKKGTKLGWCDYDANFGKKVEIFKNNKSLGIFPSCAELERQSEELFGVKLLISSISAVCNKKLKSYKDFTFKYKK